MLELRDVCFRVSENHKKKKILDKISLSVRDGDFIVITGTNGSGKSTLARVIMGIEKLSSGKIIFKGEDISRLSVTERAKKGISLSFQQPVKFKGLTVFDLLSISSASAIDNLAAQKILKNVGLDSAEYLNRELDFSLSGGELKRIEIATVLARGADFLIFDEPEAGIDLWSFDNLLKIFRKLHKDGKTIIVISHQERILKVTDKIIILKNGKISKMGDREKILPEILEKKNEF